MMSAEQYDAAQSQLLSRQRCASEHRLELEIVRVEAAREIARLEQSIAEDQHQIDDLIPMITTYWIERLDVPGVQA